ncbi:MAG: type 4a pilus biogenesis protein PilO [Gammaproteobacteria bacterium]|nr:type 4a pilus biogenesis protein PilO [Gammaproteobacteria bacterium]
MIAYIQTLDLRKIKLAGALLVFVITVLMIVFLVLPEVRLYQSQDNKRTILERAVKNSSHIFTQVETEKNLVAKLKEKLHGDMANLPDKQIESYIVSRLQTISWDNNVELSGIKPYKGGAIHNFNELLFDVDAHGSYESIYLWLRSLSKELGFVVVRKFKISPKGGAASGGLLHVQITMASYRNA